MASITVFCASACRVSDDIINFRDIAEMRMIFLSIGMDIQQSVFVRIVEKLRYPNLVPAARTSTCGRLMALADRSPKAG